MNYLPTSSEFDRYHQVYINRLMIGKKQPCTWLFFVDCGGIGPFILNCNKAHDDALHDYWKKNLK